MLRGRRPTAGKHGHDLRVSRLAHAQRATWKTHITELDGETELGRGSPVPAADQPQVVVRERVEAGQGAVIEGGRQFGELGALGRSEQLAGGHSGLAYAAWSTPTIGGVVAENCVFAAVTLSWTWLALRP